MTYKFKLVNKVWLENIKFPTTKKIYSSAKHENLTLEIHTISSKIFTEAMRHFPNLLNI